MKLFKKLICIIFLCLCCTALATSVGCQTFNVTGKCEGIIESYSVEDIYIKIRISEAHESLYCYPSLLIYESTLEEYNCSSINELLINEDYTTNRQLDWTLILNEGEALAASAFLKVHGDKLLYMLIYTGTEINIDEELPESYFTIANPTNYIGSIKFN